MKKKLLVAIVCVLAAMAGANAQKVTFGVRTGMNLSNASGDFKDEFEGADFKSKVGFHLGAVADVQFTDNFYLQPGLYFSTKGLKAEAGDEYESEEMKYNLNYLELPILASYRMNLTDKIEWQINAGPYLAFGVGGKVKDCYTYNDGEDVESEDIIVESN